MNDIAEVNSSLNEYGFESYSFLAEVAEHDDLQALDLEFCKFAQATGTNYIEMCKRVAAIHENSRRSISPFSNISFRVRESNKCSFFSSLLAGLYSINDIR